MFEETLVVLTRIVQTYPNTDVFDEHDTFLHVSVYLSLVLLLISTKEWLDNC